MTAALPKSLQVQDLNNVDGAAFRAGGTSRAVRTVTYRGQGPFVLKVYQDSREVDSPALAALVNWRRTLPEADRAKLDSFAAFPLAVVNDRTNLAGVLLEHAPDRFIGARNGRRAPVNADLIALDRQGAASLGHPYIEPPRKLAYVGALLGTLHWLHRHEVIFGDVQPSNILVDLSGISSDVFLLDCDSVIRAGVAAVPQAEPDLWQRPGGGPFDERSDIYKAVLLAVRALLEDMAVGDPFAPDDLTDFMSSDHARRVVAILHSSSDFPVGQAWRLANVWKRSVHLDGSMYVSADDVDLKRWAPHPVPGPDHDVDKPTSVAPLPRAGSSQRRSRWSTGWGVLAGAGAVSVVAVGLVLSGTVPWPVVASEPGTSAGVTTTASSELAPTQPAVADVPTSDFVPASAVPVPAELTDATVRWVGTAVVLTVHVASLTNTTATDQVYSWACDRPTPEAAKTAPPGPYVWVDAPLDFAGGMQSADSWYQHRSETDTAAFNAYMPAACAVGDTPSSLGPLATTWIPVTVPAGQTIAVPAQANTLEFVLPTAGLAAGTLPETGYPGTIWGLYFLSDDSASVATASLDP